MQDFLIQTLSSASSSQAAKITVEFPNLFGGFQAEYSRSFGLFGIQIYWYGVLIAVGVALAYLYAMRRMTKDFGIVKDRAFDVVFVATIGGFLCARIYYCVFRTLDPNSGTKYNFITMFTTIRDGGIAIYGGIIGAVLIGLLICKLRKVNFFAMADVAALGFLIGQGIGRWGNFVNQEAYGDVCSNDWLFGMTGTRIAEEIGSTKALVHPCFLYESAWCILGFVLLHFYSKKLRTYDGEIALLYAAWYGFERMFVEGIRADSLYLGSIRISQLVAVVTFAAATILFVVFKILTKRSGKPLYVNSEASAALIEADRLAEEERKAKKNKKAPSILEDEAASENADAQSENSEITDNAEAENTSEDISENSEVTDNAEAKNTSENITENSDEITHENTSETPEEKSDDPDGENKPQKGVENQSENTDD